MQRASLEARQQDVRDRQLALAQNEEYVEKLKVCAGGSRSLGGGERPPHTNVHTLLHTVLPAAVAAPRRELSQGMLREGQQAAERLAREHAALGDKAARLHHTLEDHIHANTQLLADNSQRQVEIKGKEDEIRALRVRGVAWCWVWVHGCGQGRRGGAGRRWLVLGEELWGRTL